MYCKNCGKKVKDIYLHCKYCGIQTHKGIVHKRLKRIFSIGFGVVVIFAILLTVLAQSGLFERMRIKKEQKVFAKEQSAFADRTLQDYKFNCVTVGSAGVTMDIYFDGDKNYLLGTINESEMLGYTKGKKLLTSTGGSDFTESDSKPFTIEDFSSYLESIRTSIEYQQTGDFTGTVSNGKDIVNSYKKVIDGIKVEQVKIKNIPYKMTLSKDGKDLKIVFELSSGKYTVSYSYDEMDVRRILEGNILSRYTDGGNSLQGTYYRPEEETEVAIKKECVSLTADFEPQVMVLVNGKSEFVEYDAVSLKNHVLTLRGVSYPKGTKDNYEAEQEELRRIEEEKAELLSFVKSKIELNKEYSLVTADTKETVKITEINNDSTIKGVTKRIFDYYDGTSITKGFSITTTFSGQVDKKGEYAVVSVTDSNTEMSQELGCPLGTRNHFSFSNGKAE